MKKNFIWSVLAIMMVTMMTVSFASCSNDDNNDNGSNSVTSHIVGNWFNGEMVVTFINNGTGTVSHSTNENKIPNGSFKYGKPYEVETERGQTYFLIKVTYTSGNSTGKAIEWEIGYTLESNGDTSWINIEGTRFYKK